MWKINEMEHVKTEMHNFLLKVAEQAKKKRTLILKNIGN